MNNINNKIFINQNLIRFAISFNQRAKGWGWVGGSLKPLRQAQDKLIE